MGRRGGAALVIALVVLAVLAMLGAPFAASMLLRRKQTMRSQAVHRLRNASYDLRNRCYVFLLGTCEEIERRRFDEAFPPGKRPMPSAVTESGVLRSARGQRGTDTMPRRRPHEMDGPEELAPPSLTFTEETQRGLRLTAQGTVADEQGKVDVATASFVLLGNVFGSSHLADEVSAEAHTLPVVDAKAFPADNDPATLDGLLVLFDELSGTFEAVTYTERTASELRGVQRGQLLTPARPHRRGTYVCDARALKIYLHRFFGSREPFASLSGLRQINTWPLARFFATQLWHYHLSVSRLPRSSALERLLGVQTQRVEPAELGGAEKKLLTAGLDPELLREAERVLGEQAVCDLARKVEKEGGGAALKELTQELASQRNRYFSAPRLLRGGLGRITAIMEREGLEGLGAGDLHRIDDLLTVHARSPVRFSPEVVLRGEPYLGTYRTSFGGYPFAGCFSVVRIRPPGGGAGQLNLLCGARPFVMGPYAGKEAPGVLAWRLRGPAAAALTSGKALGAALVRSPVNINSAPWSVLVAVLKGVRLSGTFLRSRGVARTEPVTSPQARALADMLWEQIPVSDLGQYCEILRSAQRSGIITEAQRIALVVNAVNPTSPRLAASTCPFTFSSCDTYSLSSVGVARRGRMQELGRLYCREIFHVAPGGISQIVWETEADWNAAVRLGFTPPGAVEELSGERALKTLWWRIPFPDRQSHLMTTYGIGRGTAGVGRAAEYVPPSTPGVLTSVAAQLPPHPGRGGLTRHFESTKEGVFMRSGDALSFPFPVRFPCAVDFFLCPLWEGGAGEVPLVTITRGGVRAPGDAVTLSYDCGTAELLLRVLGGAKPDPARFSDADQAFVGVRAALPRPLVRDTWYHIALVVMHPEPGGQALFLDGRLVGHGNMVGTLSGGLASGTGAGSFSVEEKDAAYGMPVRGPFWIGDEILYVGSRSGNRFQFGPFTESDDGETGRGCRGSAAVPHRRAPVRPVGYRVRIRPSVVGLDRTLLYGGPGRFDWITDAARFAIPAVPQRTGRPSLALRPGGARLARPLGKAQRVVGAMPQDFSLTANNPRLRPTERELLRNLTGRLAPVPYTYPLIIALVGYGGKVQQGPPGGPPEGPGRPGGIPIPPGAFPRPRKAAPGAVPRQQRGGAFYPIGPEFDYLVVPIDPRQAGFAEQGVLRIRYRFEGEGQLGRGGSVSYDRIVEYTGIERRPVPGDKEYPAFVGLRDLSSGPFVYRGEQRILVNEFLSETRPLRQLRVYGISVPAAMSNLAARYPHAGVIQIANRGRTAAVFPQMRDVEWIRYNYIYKNYFLSSVENRIQEDDWKSDPAFQPRNENNTVLRGFCGAITPTRGGAGWAESFDPQSIGDHSAGAEIKPVFWVLSALPGAGDGVWLGPRRDPDTAEFLHIQKKAETDQGVFISFQERFRRTYSEEEEPVLRAFPEPAVPGGARRGAGAQGQLIFGPSPYQRGGTLVALLDEVRTSYSHILSRAPDRYTLRSATGSPVIPAAKGGLELLFISLPGQDAQNAQVPGFSFPQGESVLALGSELIHIRLLASQRGAGGSVQIPKDFSEQPLQAMPPGRVPAGAAAGQAAFAPVLFLSPRQLREPHPRLSILGTVPPWARSGGYLAVQGFGGLELWSFQRAAGSTLSGVRRGILGTCVAVTALWPQGTLRGTILPACRFELVRGGLLDWEAQEQELSHNFGIFAHHIRVADGAVTQSGLAGPKWNVRSGYVRVDDGTPLTEDRIVAFVRGRHLILDELTRRPVLSLTGCFGTFKGTALRGSLINLPFRYYDRYVLGAVTAEAQHFTRSMRRPGVLWRRLSWEHAPSEAQGRLGPEPRIHVLVRFDGEPPWHTKPAGAENGLYLFSDPVPPEGFRLEREADQLELRILFFWPEGAYGGTRATGFSDTWKAAPRLRSLVVEYQDRGGVLRREELVQ